MFSRILKKSGDGAPKPVVANMGTANKMYFNQDLKRWVLPGKEDEVRDEMMESDKPPPLPSDLPPPSGGSPTATGGDLASRYPVPCYASSYIRPPSEQPLSGSGARPATVPNSISAQGPPSRPEQQVSSERIFASRPPRTESNPQSSEPPPTPASSVVPPLRVTAGMNYPPTNDYSTHRDCLPGNMILDEYQSSSRAGSSRLPFQQHGRTSSRRGSFGSDVMSIPLGSDPRRMGLSRPPLPGTRRSQPEHTTSGFPVTQQPLSQELHREDPSVGKRIGSSNRRQSSIDSRQNQYTGPSDTASMRISSRRGMSASQRHGADSRGASVHMGSPPMSPQGRGAAAESALHDWFQYRIRAEHARQYSGRCTPEIRRQPGPTENGTTPIAASSCRITDGLSKELTNVPSLVEYELVGTLDSLALVLKIGTKEASLFTPEVVKKLTPMVKDVIERYPTNINLLTSAQTLLEVLEANAGIERAAAFDGSTLAAHVTALHLEPLTALHSCHARLQAAWETAKYNEDYPHHSAPFNTADKVVRQATARAAAAVREVQEIREEMHKCVEAYKAVLSRAIADRSALEARTATDEAVLPVIESLKSERDDLRERLDRVERERDAMNNRLEDMESIIQQRLRDKDVEFSRRWARRMELERTEMARRRVVDEEHQKVVEQYKKENAELMRRLDELSTTDTSALVNTRSLELEVEETHQKVLDLEEQNLHLEATVVALREDVANEKAKNTPLRSECDELRVQLDNSQSNLVNLESEMVEVKRELREAEQRDVMKTSELAELRSIVTNLENEQGRLKKLHEENQEQIRIMAEGAELAESRLLDEERKAEEWEERATRAENLLEDFRRQTQDVREQTDVEVARTRQALTAAEEALKSMEKELDQVRKELQFRMSDDVTVGMNQSLDKEMVRTVLMALNERVDAVDKGLVAFKARTSPLASLVKTEFASSDIGAHCAELLIQAIRQLDTQYLSECASLAATC